MTKNATTNVGDSQNQGGESRGISRRKFLKILGGSSAAVVATGCADSNVQTIFPNLKGEPEQVPGVAVWYSSTCGECSAGCGIQVRTREGRAVKIEGNPDSPINHGGLCALGQASLQGLYDPDRVRQPLKRGSGEPGASQFEPTSWEQGYAIAADALKATNGKKVLITGEVSGALEELMAAWCKAHNVEHIVYDVTQPTAVARASEIVYGEYGVPTYSFDKAQAILNFGADFLETWVSPCEYARSWSKGRKAEKPVRFFHVEPRLSLTGANADTWLRARPGSELYIALYVLRSALEQGRDGGLNDDAKQSLVALTKKVDLDSVVERTGVDRAKILLATSYLLESKNSLVLSGGVASSNADALPLALVCAVLNVVLGNVGVTVDISKMRTPRSSVKKVAELVQALKAGEVASVFMHGTNPAFTLPGSFGLREALRSYRKEAKSVVKVVSFASHLDESAAYADVVLPAHHSLESWGDTTPYRGVYGLSQPVMRPVFDTHSLGDMLIDLSVKVGNDKVGGGAQNFEGFLQARWKKIHSDSGVGGDAHRFWLESLERGGYFPEQKVEIVRIKDKVSGEAVKPIQAAMGSSEHHTVAGSVVYPFFSVKSFDGRAANRPWLQEIPDPITQIAWDSWAEIHPETAKKSGIATGDFVSVKNYNGEVNVPAFVTEFVDPGIIAVPIGQGHTGYGRFAKKVGSGNVLDLLGALEAKEIASRGDSLTLLEAKVEISKGWGDPNLVITQGSDSQMGRDLAKTTFLGGALSAASAHAEHGEGGHSEGEHEPKQMYQQRKHPLYEWALVVDLSACTGCSACVVACYAENNIAVVGKQRLSEGREMSWLRIERYHDHAGEELTVSFLPMMCQHCHNAPCEPVCPVYATYHNEEGLNAMIYNRCVGTRYCSNNCSYKVRRFNWVETELPSPLDWQLNPDVTKRVSGIMEKCTFCIQRISEAKDRAKDQGRLVRDGEIQPACVQGCPTQALAFGNYLDAESKVRKLAESSRTYRVLDHHINTQPAVRYLERVRYTPV